jgi:glycosyltransferase involved in cell wall biosynthesis
MNKIFFVSTARVPTQRAHGLQIMKTCEALANAGADVELVIPSRFNELSDDPFDYYKVQRNFNIRTIRSLNLAPRREPAHPVFYWIQAWTFALSALLYLWKEKDAYIYFRYDVPLLITFQAFFRRRMLVCEAHFLIHGRAKRLLLRCFGVITIVDAAKEIYERAEDFSDNILVAPDGVTVSDFNISVSQAEARKRLGLPHEKKLILYTGYFYAWKGVNALVKAVRYLNENIEIVLVGGYEKDRQQIEKIMDEEEFSEIERRRVTIIGHRPYAEMPYYQRAADCLVVTGVKKGDRSMFTSPLKLFEYMASGVPIVASGNVSIKEVLTHQKNAYLVEPENPRALAVAVTAVLSNMRLAERIALQARTDVLKYDWAIRGKKIWDFMSKQQKAPRVAYLFAGKRESLIQNVRAHMAPDSELIGLNYLYRFGIRGTFLETPLMNMLRKLFFNAAQLPALWRVRTYDVVFLGSNLPFVFLIKKILHWQRPRVVLYNTFFTHTLKRHPNGWYGALLRSALRSADAIVCPTEAQTDFLKKEKIDSHRIHLVLNGVDTDFFAPARADLSETDGYILSIGKDLGRDYPTLIAAASRIPETTFYIIAAERNLKNVPALPANIKVFFDVPHKETLAFYRKAKFVIIPTYSEESLRGSDCSGQYALLDAMAARKAIIVSSRSTLSDYIEAGKDALIVKAEDPDELITAIRLLGNDSALRDRLGKAALAKAEERFTTEKLAERLSIVFRSVSHRSFYLYE